MHDRHDRQMPWCPDRSVRTSLAQDGGPRERGVWDKQSRWGLSRGLSVGPGGLKG